VEIALYTIPSTLASLGVGGEQKAQGKGRAGLMSAASALVKLITRSQWHIGKDFIGQPTHLL